MTWRLNNNVSLKENSRIFISAGRERMQLHEASAGGAELKHRRPVCQNHHCHLRWPCHHHLSCYLSCQPVGPLVLRTHLRENYVILLFAASDLASITSHIHNWVLFLLWFSVFILSGVISELLSSLYSRLQLILPKGKSSLWTVHISRTLFCRLIQSLVHHVSGINKIFF